MNTETTWKQDIKNPEIYKHMPSWVFGMFLLWFGYGVYATIMQPIQTLIGFGIIGLALIVGHFAKKVVISRLETLDKQ